MLAIEGLRRVLKDSAEGTELVVKHGYWEPRKYSWKRWRERKFNVFFPKVSIADVSQVAGLYCIKDNFLVSLRSDWTAYGFSTAPFFLERNTSEYYANALASKGKKLGFWEDYIQWDIHDVGISWNPIHKITDSDDLSDIKAKLDTERDAFEKLISSSGKGYRFVPFAVRMGQDKSVIINGTMDGECCNYFAKILSDELYDKALQAELQAQEEQERLERERLWKEQKAHADYYERVGRYEEAARIYEHAGFEEEAKRLRDKARGAEIVRVDVNQLIRQLDEKGFTITYHCANCRAPVNIDAKTDANSVQFCSHCGSRIEPVDLAKFVRKYLS